MTIPEGSPEEFIQVDIALFHESIKLIFLAGLLTYFSLAPSHYCGNSDILLICFAKFTAAGLFRIYT
ncbi:hypothetical protein ATB96_12780 [Elizabethkingia ursingii]|nr:hypothetical protein ATB96_12780 [Elizabethkingia ursingii]